MKLFKRKAHAVQASLKLSPHYGNQQCPSPSPSPRPASQYMAETSLLGPPSAHSPPQIPSPFVLPSPNMPAPTDVSTSTTYTPVQYDVDENKLSAISPEAFYGSLLDENKPSTIFCYLTDALFFHIDTHCDVPGLRGTGVIEPEKLVWMKKTMGMGDEAASVLSMNLLLLYKTARVPYHGITSSSGDNVPTLDRRAFLHLAVFEAQAAPNETFGSWSQAITQFSLLNPGTTPPVPFPIPFPRSALPPMANPSLASAYNTWRWQAVANAQRARSDEAMRMMYSAAGIGPSSPMFTIGSHANPQGQLGGCQVPNFENTSPGSKRYTGSAASSPTPSYDGYGRQYGNGGNNPDAGGDSHATWLDTTNAVLNLANTVMGGSGNGDGSPGGVGSGNSASGGFNFNDDGGFGSQEFDGGWNSGGSGSPFGTQTFNSAGGFGDGGFSDQQFGTGEFGGAGMMYTHGPNFGGGEVSRGYNGGFGDAGLGFIF